MAVTVNTSVSGGGSGGSSSSTTINNYTSSISKPGSLAGRASAASFTATAESPILDVLAASALGAWGFVKHRAAYAGKCCNVRRASDNATMDIPFTSDNIVDSGLLVAFAGASTLFLVTMYDQVGANNITQATAANQPPIDLTVRTGGVPCISPGTSGNNYFMAIPVGVSITSTANCAVWAAIGNFSPRVGGIAYDLGATSATFALSVSPFSQLSAQVAVNGTFLGFGNQLSVPASNGSVVGVNSAAGGMTLFHRNASFTRAAVSAVASVGGVWPTSAINSTQCDLMGMIIFNTALSANDAQLLQYGMSAAYGCGLVPQAMVLLHGDSIVATGGQGFPPYDNYNKALFRYLPKNITLYNVGQSGQSLASGVSDLPNYVTPMFLTGMPNVAVMMYGVNDIMAGTTAVALEALATTWSSTVVAAGFIPLAAVLYPRQVTGGYTAAMEVQRQLFNTWLRANSGTGKIFTGIVDFELEPTLLPFWSASDSPDNLHPSWQCYQKTAPILADAIVQQLYGI